MSFAWEEHVDPLFDDSPAYAAIIDAFDRSPVAGEHLNVFVGYGTVGFQENARGFVIDFLRGLLRADDALPFSGEELLAECERFWSSFQERSVELTMLAPCWGFELPPSGVDMGEGCRLERVSRRLRRELGAADVHAVDWTSDPPTAAFVYRERVEKTFGKEVWDKRGTKIVEWTRRGAEAIQAASEGLSLFKNGSFERGRWVTAAGAHGRSRSYERGTNWGVRDSFRKPSYRIKDETEAAELERLRGVLLGLTPAAARHLRVPLRRFHLATVRHDVADAFIDLLIAVEALVSDDTEKSELNYRVAQRMALLVGKSPTERREIAKQMKAAYDVRSRLVHGRDLEKVVKVGGRKVPPSAFLDEVREIVRRAILAGVESAANQPNGSSLFDWDSMIFGQPEPEGGSNAPPTPEST